MTSVSFATRWTTGTGTPYPLSYIIFRPRLNLLIKLLGLTKTIYTLNKGGNSLTIPLNDFLDGVATQEMKLPGLKPGVSLLLERNSSEAVPLFAQRRVPVHPAHSSPGLKAWGFLRRRINHLAVHYGYTYWGHRLNSDNNASIVVNDWTFNPKI